MKTKELIKVKQFENAVEQLKQVCEKRWHTLAYEVKEDKIFIRIFEKLSEEQIAKLVDKTVL